MSQYTLRACGLCTIRLSIPSANWLPRQPSIEIAVTIGITRPTGVYRPHGTAVVLRSIESQFPSVQARYEARAIIDEKKRRALFDSRNPRRYHSRFKHGLY